MINALSFLVSAGLIALIKVPSPKTTDKQMTPVKDFIEGMRYLREYLPSLALVAIELGWGAAIFAGYGVFWGLITVCGPFHISEATMVDSEQRVTRTQSAD